MARQIVTCICDGILSRLFVTLAYTNHRTISDTQPGRERPRNRPWGQGQGSGGGVAHVPAALRGAVGRRQKPPPLLHQSARLTVRKLSQRIRLRARGLAPQVPTIASTCGPVPPEEGVMDALASSPLPSPLSDLTRDGVLPQEGGRRPPWRLLPLLLPLAFVSGPSRNPQVDVARSGRDTVRRKRSAGKIGL